MLPIIPAQASDLPEIELLLDAGFGPARHNRTAYRLRDGVVADPAQSFVAREGDTLVGSVQCWPIQLRGQDGRRLPLVLLGPVVTAAARRGEGIGSRLITAALAAVDTAPVPVLLIGDADFYGRFGFSAAATAGWRLPGPVDHARLLLRWTGAALPAAGWIEADSGVRRAA